MYIKKTIDGIGKKRLQMIQYLQTNITNANSYDSYIDDHDATIWLFTN
jgi:hypothetical protein